MLFLALSEDVIENQQLFIDTKDVAVLQPADYFEDICLLTLCDGLILSTGTYSWWSGFLNDGPVVASRLFHKPGLNHYANLTDEFFTPNMIVL